MLEKIPVHHQKFSILSHEADIHNCASLFSLSNYMQEAGRNHAEQLGWGTQLFKEKKQFWVLSRIIIEVDKYPKTGSEIDIETWPKNKDKIFALRDFFIRQNDEIIARCTSSWALLQLASRRPVPLEDMGQISASRQEKHAIRQVPQKLASIDENSENFSHKVVFSELDQNAHVNNGRYINWLMDTFPLEFHKKHRAVRIQLNYLAEVFYDQQLHIARLQSGEFDYFFEVSNLEKKAVFRAEILFAPLR